MQERAVRLRFFASLREALGHSELEVTTAAGCAGALRDELIARGDVWAQALGRERAVRIAVNQVMAEETTPLSAGCEVAFFPPVTGG